MDIEAPHPASLDDIEDAPDLEEGFAYTEAAHKGAMAASETAGYFVTLLNSGMSRKQAMRLTEQWLGYVREDEDE